MDDSSYRLNFDLGKKNEIHCYIARKSSLKLQSLVAKYCKMRNIANFVYFCIICRFLIVLYAEICTTFGSKVVQISVRNTKVYKIRETCRAISSSFYNISRPNFPNFTLFKMLFLAVVMDFVLHA